MIPQFKLQFTKSFDKELDKQIKKDPSLKKKLLNTFNKLRANPFQGEKVEASILEQRRIWVGVNHRLFYDINNDKVVLLSLKKKDKHTYR